MLYVNSQLITSRILNGEDDNDRHDKDVDDTGTGTQTLTKPKLEEPKFYKVVLLNDDFTPMDFVVHVLAKFFQKNADEATKIMLEVHHQGSGVAGTFSFEIAETKVYLVNDYSRKNKHPLKCVMEKA